MIRRERGLCQTRLQRGVNEGRQLATEYTEGESVHREKQCNGQDCVTRIVTARLWRGVSAPS